MKIVSTGSSIAKLFKTKRDFGSYDSKKAR